METPAEPPLTCLGGCGRKLTSDRARARGYGERCWRKLRHQTPSPTRFSRTPVKTPAHTEPMPGQTAIDLQPMQPTLWSL